LRVKARASDELVLALPLDSARARCRDVLGQFGEQRPTPDEDVLEAVTPSNRRSSGTVIRVELARTLDGTKVSVSAWPGAQLYDWRESQKIVAGIVSRLKGHS
jgi:hypothetical protein